MENIRSRHWCLVLYPDEPSHLECIQSIERSSNTFAFILHDRDIWVEGESEKYTPGDLKKPHYHVVLKGGNARFRNPLASELGVEPNRLEPCRDLKKSLLYLIHDGYPSKYQYDLDDVVGPLKDTLATLLTTETEEERVLKLVELIESVPACTYKDILTKACRAGLWAEFRKLGVGVKYLIDEQNESDEVKYLRKRQADDFREWLNAKGGG